MTVIAAQGATRVFVPPAGGGGLIDGAKVTRNDPFLSSPVSCPDSSTSVIDLPQPIADSAFYSDGVGLTIPAGKAGLYQCSGEIETTDYFTDGISKLVIGATTIEPVESPDTIETIMYPHDWTGYFRWSCSGALWLAVGDTLQLSVRPDGTGGISIIRASLAAFRVPLGPSPTCDSPIAMNLPGSDAYADDNGNDVSGPLTLAAGDRVLLNVNVTSSDYTAGYVGIYSPSLSSYGTTGYVALTSSTFTGSFLVDADASDWYVFVQSPGISYDPDLDGSPMTYCVIPAPVS